MPSRSVTDRILWLTLAAVVVAFVSATALSQYRSARIDALASSIATNASPSVVELSAARTELRHLESLLIDYVGGNQTDSARRANIDTVRTSYADHVLSYLNLPVFPGEREHWAEVSHGLHHVDDTVTRILTLADSGQRDSARAVSATALHDDIDTASRGLQGSIDFNAQQASQAALQVERLRSQMGQLAFALDFVCVCLTIAAGISLRRALNRSTELVRAHASELERRNRELEMFSARVAHDIVSPLTAASTALDFAEANGKDDTRVRAILGAGKRSVIRVRRIVDALLDFARAGASPRSDARAELDEVLRDVIDGASGEAEAAGIEISMTGDAGRAVRCSPGALTSVISNLVNNAIKYMNAAATRIIEIRVRDRDAFVRVEVADSGPGLPPGLDRQSLFEPYVRDPNAGSPGLGLGLATVRRIVRAHGGEVGVESTPGRGSVFWFELQRFAPRAAEASNVMLSH